MLAAQSTLGPVQPKSSLLRATVVTSSFRENVKPAHIYSKTINKAPVKVIHSVTKRRLHELRDFKERHGHALVPYVYPSGQLVRS